MKAYCDLEYKGLSEQEFEKEIKQIYLEEYRKELPADVEIISSSDSTNSDVTSSDYDGTAIHFHSKDNNINEVYVISQGTKNMVDWEVPSRSLCKLIEYPRNWGLFSDTFPWVPRERCQKI
ncbi:DUF6792 domain-containing protein [Lentibacillus kapialis]|uniref:DUF6792 domain-containing protein n=1 Tax=Lentibacillus kapialis TaxID=340214 RepID=UPI0027E51919|nr:DUF6792 domain-containing protein [Lentibacillus kapialis]